MIKQMNFSNTFFPVKSANPEYLSGQEYQPLVPVERNDISGSLQSSVLRCLSFALPLFRIIETGYSCPDFCHFPVTGSIA